MIGFVVAAARMTLIALAKRDEIGAAYSLLVLVPAGAPLARAVYSVLAKPLAGRASTLVWTYLVIAAGGVVVLPLLPLGAWAELAALDGPGWLALGYLVLPCTVGGYAVWTRLQEAAERGGHLLGRSRSRFRSGRSGPGDWTAHFPSL